MGECPSGTPKSTRLKEDLKKAISVLSEVDQSINSHSIKDVYRLGKYSPDNRKPSPLLVKFIRAADATSILSKKMCHQAWHVTYSEKMWVHTSKGKVVSHPVRCTSWGHQDSWLPFTCQEQTSWSSHNVCWVWPLVQLSQLLFLLNTILLAVRYPLWLLPPTLHTQSKPVTSPVALNETQLASKLHLLNILLCFLLPPPLALLPLQSLINDYQMTSIFVT